MEYHRPLKLMCVLAHPDDESFATGGILARYAASGVETYLVMATRGEKGWFEDPAGYPGPRSWGRLREEELRAAADPRHCGQPGSAPHSVAKLYYRAFLRGEQEAYQAALGPLEIPVDGVTRSFA